LTGCDIVEALNQKVGPRCPGETERRWRSGRRPRPVSEVEVERQHDSLFPASPAGQAPFILPDSW